MSIPRIWHYYANLNVLGECLALDFHDKHKTYIWVMKEYKVQSSWTLMYEIPYCDSEVLCLSNGYGSNIILREYSEEVLTQMRFAKYNAKGELLQYFDHPSLCYSFLYHNRGRSYFLYIESLLTLPSDLLRMRIRKLAIEFAENVLNNLMLLKIRITRGSNEQKELGASIQGR
ncbi:hypothetical protein PIB30_099353 [Stylosanthes scabra]|uniref:F-box associated domain-containing protein n=1 Tax=Stylosanthes scabra TaxID=79078 RepID=A0ABU6YY95_9FABA|nr:hypothetical protein [Stylosanthes scabra]